MADTPQEIIARVKHRNYYARTQYEPDILWLIEQAEKATATPPADAPCPACGYNGPGYYQPETHPCVKKTAPPADSAMVDATAELHHDGSPVLTLHGLASHIDAMIPDAESYDKTYLTQAAAALRARAVPDCAAIAAEYLEAKRVIDAGPQLPDSGFAPRRSWKHGEPEVVRWHKASAALAMLAASKAAEGK